MVMLGRPLHRSALTLSDLKRHGLSSAGVGAVTPLVYIQAARLGGVVKDVVGRGATLKLNVKIDMTRLARSPLRSRCPHMVTSQPSRVARREHGQEENHPELTLSFV